MAAVLWQYSQYTRATAQHPGAGTIDTSSSHEARWWVRMTQCKWLPRLEQLPAQPQCTSPSPTLPLMSSQPDGVA